MVDGLELDCRAAIGLGVFEPCGNCNACGSGSSRIEALVLGGATVVCFFWLWKKNQYLKLCHFDPMHECLLKMG